MSAVFGLSICVVRCNNSTVGNENDLLGLLIVFVGGGFGGGGGDSKKGGLGVAKKMKICSSIHAGKILTHRMFSAGWTVSCVSIVPDRRYH
jgi:hypothetical protein